MLNNSLGDAFAPKKRSLTTISMRNLWWGRVDKGEVNYRPIFHREKGQSARMPGHESILQHYGFPLLQISRISARWPFSGSTEKCELIW